MTPAFLEWVRSGPRAEKRFAAISGVIVLALVAWSAAPTTARSHTTAAGPAPAITTTDESDTGLTEVASPAQGEAGSTTATTTSASADISSAPDAEAAPTPGAAPPAVEGRCGAQGATDQGVSDTEIRVAVTVFNVFGANSSIGVPGADEQKAAYEALFSAVNDAGGIQCRDVVATFYEMNPLDQSSQQAGCLRIVEDDVFALVGAGGFFPQSQSNCIPQNGIPIFAWYGLLPSEQERFFPYVFSVQGRVDRIMRAWAIGARDQAFFDPARGFEKLGIFGNNCSLEANRALEVGLASVGIPASSISKFVTECPASGQTPPNQCTQAALQHSSDGVTHVFLAAGGSPNNCYVNAAARQRFLPTYSTSDYIQGIGPPVVGETPNAQAFDGALGVTATRFGQFNSGLPADAGTRWCNDAYAAHDVPRITAEDAGNLVYGTACTSVQLFVAAASATPDLTRVGLADGLASAGPVAFSWPGVDGLFDTAGKVSGGDHYRAVRWAQGCECWKVISPTFLRTPA